VLGFKSESSERGTTKYKPDIAKPRLVRALFYALAVLAGFRASFLGLKLKRSTSSSTRPHSFDTILTEFSSRVSLLPQLLSCPIRIAQCSVLLPMSMLL
jgi:hypothetical protein